MNPRLARLKAAVLAGAPVVGIDLTGIAGIGLVVYGVSMIYLPAAVIVAGAGMVALAWIWASR